MSDPIRILIASYTLRLSKGKLRDFLEETRLGYIRGADGEHGALGEAEDDRSMRSLDAMSGTETRTEFDVLVERHRGSMVYQTRSSKR